MSRRYFYAAGLQKLPPFYLPPCQKIMLYRVRCFGFGLDNKPTIPSEVEALARWEVRDILMEAGILTDPKLVQVGPGGGRLNGIAVNPHNPDNILISCDMGSCFVTTDRCRTFHQFRVWGSPTTFCFHPSDPQKVYTMVGDVFYVSTDSGRTWAFYYPTPELVDYIGHKFNASGSRNNGPAPQYSYWQIGGYCKS